MNKSASIVKATSFMAGNGFVLLKVFDVLNAQPEPIKNVVLMLAILALPPIVGLICGWVLLARIENDTYTGKGSPDQWLDGLAMMGIGLPLGLWMMRLVQGPSI